MCSVHITISTKRHAFCTSYWKRRLSSTTMACTRPARSRSQAQMWEQTQQFVRALPAAKLLELRCWRVACQCICEEDDCRCQTLSCFKVGRFRHNIPLWGSIALGHRQTNLKSRPPALKSSGALSAAAAAHLSQSVMQEQTAPGATTIGRRVVTTRSVGLQRCAEILARVRTRRTWSRLPVRLSFFCPFCKP